jgi:hypothetical protein
MNPSAKIRHPTQEVGQIINIIPLLQSLGGLVRVTDTVGDDERTVSLHFSFKSFLKNKHECRNAFFIDEKSGNLLIAAACMLYLADTSIENPDSLYDPKNRRAKLDKDYLLFSYATLHLSSHLLGVELIPTSHVQSLIASLKTFCRLDGLLTWFTSLLVYIDQSVSWLGDVHITSVLSTLIEIRDWLRKQGLEKRLLKDIDTQSVSRLSVIKSKFNPRRSRAEDPDLVAWANMVASRVWVTGPTKPMSRSVAAYDFTSRLYEVSHSDRALKYELTFSGTATYSGNLGHSYARPDSSEDLRLAAECYNYSLKHS